MMNKKNIILLSFLFLLSIKCLADTAIFAGGCFWCMQSPFDAEKNNGVISTQVGYTGGSKDNPTYKEVSSGVTGHREAIEVTYDSKKISYKRLLEIFWKNIDPYDAAGQFCDKGEQYTSAIFYKNDKEKLEALASAPKGNVKTSFLPATKFYSAEDYHQSYYKKNPIRYNYYRYGCGRDARLKQLWGKSAH